MKLTGQKCFLRAIEPHDVEHLFRWENDVDNWLVSGTKTPFSKAELQKYVTGIRDIYADRQLRLIISTDQKPVGTIDLYDFDPGNKRAGVGILIGETSERGKGLAQDALEVLIDYAFDILLLHQLYSSIPAYNDKSISLFEKLGFIQVGTRREWLKSAEGWHDEHLYQLLRP
ncbi:MAG: GNAT family protein [Bacteroidota bacterium]